MQYFMASTLCKGSSKNFHTAMPGKPRVSDGCLSGFMEALLYIFNGAFLLREPHILPFTELSDIVSYFAISYSFMLANIENHRTTGNGSISVRGIDRASSNRRLR
jgi:hypothetical protein